MKDPLRVTTLTRIWRATRRCMSRTEWAVWLLGLSREDGEPTERGLILVQIDGLSKHQLERALEQGRMPFVGSLLEKEHYHNHVFYSGLPSSTPAVHSGLSLSISLSPGCGCVAALIRDLIRGRARPIIQVTYARVFRRRSCILKKPTRPHSTQRR